MGDNTAAVEKYINHPKCWEMPSVSDFHIINSWGKPSTNGGYCEFLFISSLALSSNLLQTEGLENCRGVFQISDLFFVDISQQLRDVLFPPVSSYHLFFNQMCLLLSPLCGPTAEGSLSVPSWTSLFSCLLFALRRYGEAYRNSFLV